MKISEIIRKAAVKPYYCNTVQMFNLMKEARS